MQDRNTILKREKIIKMIKREKKDRYKSGGVNMSFIICIEERKKGLEI